MIILYIFKFLLFLTIIIYPPGRCLFSILNLKASSRTVILISIVLGLWGVTLESYSLGIFGLKDFIIPFLGLQGLLLIIICLKYFKHKINLDFKKPNFLIVFVIILSLLINSLITFPFGTYTNKGIRFAGAHMTDNNWHLSLINSLQKSIPPELPLYAGTPVKNYHYWVDLQIAVIQSFTGIPLPILFYQIIGSFYILLYTLLSFSIGKLLTKTDFGGIILVLYIALSSNWYYLARFFYPLAYDWPSVAWVDYFSSKSVNFPLLFSMIILFILIYIFSTATKKDFKFILILSLIIGSLIPIKSHTGVVVISSIGLLSLFQLIKNKDFTELKIFLLSFLSGMLFTYLTIGSNRSPLIIHPFWFIKVMYEASDRLNFSEWELKRQYLLSVKAYLGVFKLYVQGLAIFTLININILSIGASTFFKKINVDLSKIIVFLFAISLNSFILTMLFIYDGIAIITIQFFYPTIIALSILTVMVIVEIYNRNKYLATILALLIWISLSPGVIFTLNEFSERKSGYVSPAISDAMIFLSKESQGTVIVDPKYSGSSLVSAYSGKTLFYADDIILDSLSVDYSYRKNAVINFFQCNSDKKNENFINSNKIKYIFSQKNNCIENVHSLKRIFSNNEISIYQTSI